MNVLIVNLLSCVFYCKISFYPQVPAEYKGQKVEAVKKILQQKLVDDKMAFKYQEPDKKVVSRSGDVCVVALCDQWFVYLK